jgi:hypothetical protein
MINVTELTLRLMIGPGIIGLLLSACAPQPVTPFRMSNIEYPESGQIAYLWTTGSRHQELYKGDVLDATDYATVTQIDGRHVPDDYTFETVMEPYATYLLAIPVGKHEVEIMYKKNTILCSQVSPFFIGCASTLQSRRSLTFVASPQKIYSPFAEELCSQDWFWIEDWGPYVPNQPTLRSVIDSDLSKPLVVGKTPDKTACEQSNVTPSFK